MRSGCGVEGGFCCCGASGFKTGLRKRKCRASQKSGGWSKKPPGPETYSLRNLVAQLSYLYMQNPRETETQNAELMDRACFLVVGC